MTTEVKDFFHSGPRRSRPQSNGAKGAAPRRAWARGVGGVRVVAVGVAAGVVLLLVLLSTALAKDQPESKETIKKPVTVTSERMEADRDSNIVVFTGNVVAEEDFTICSDELRVVYGAQKEVEEITARGNVRIFQEDKTSTSKGAVYNRKGRTITLTGDALVRQCTDTVRGEKIIVYIDDDRALVESGKGGRVKALIMPEKKCSGENITGKGSVEEARCKRAR